MAAKKKDKVVVSKKDKALILLIISAVISLWVLFSFFSYIFSVSSSQNSVTFKPFLYETEEKKWFNVARDLTKENLEGRIVLLDFWTYSCIRCIQNIPEIKELEERFGDKLLVIGVHSGKFENEKNPQSIKEAILKYDITHPVINDFDLEIWDSFDVKSWPSLVLISPKGDVEEIYEGGGHIEEITKDIKKLIKKHRFVLNPEPLPIVLEKNKALGNVLSFPEKVEYAKSFIYKRDRISALIISNSSDNNIIISTLEGKIIEKIGSKKAGFQDGDFRDASFNHPVGLLYSKDILYVADRGNHAIRKINFKTNKVSTIIGSGVKGEILEKEKDASEFRLSSPQDLNYFPDKNNIIISNLGTNQLLKYDIDTNKISPFAGNGKRDIIDGRYPKNALAQPSGLSVFNDRLYFVDSYSSSLRYSDKFGNVRTLIGGKINEFGNRNGDKSDGLMQNPLGLFVDKTGIYVADSYNHLVRKYDHQSKKISNYSGNGVKANNIGEITSYNEVADITSISGKFYIVDSHNNRIVVKNRVNGKTSILDILPSLRLPQDGLLEYLPNLEKLPNSIVKSNSNIDLILILSKGWKINEKAPSFFNLIEIVGKKEANLIASYDWNMVKSGKIKLPKMSSKYKYYLQGTLYYCEKKKDALCFIHSYESKIIPTKASDIKSIKISL
jgi:thiol-disulfide isomerase/thioredoxin